MKSDYNSKSEEYYSLARPEIQQFIQPNINALLDVGCGSGQMASELKLNKNINEVWGIELVETAGLKAKEKLDRVIISPVENAIDELPNNYFDAIIFADVLEHLIEPEEILRKIKSKLKSEGQIIASIPNVRHWSIIKQLLEGDWRYEEYGLLDRTHLRFFTKKTIIEMFSNAGLKADILGSSFVEKVELSDELIEKLFKNGINAQTLKSEINDFQYFVRGAKNLKAIFISVDLVSSDLMNKLMSLPNDLKKNLIFNFVYETESEVVDFLKNLSLSNNSIETIKKENILITNYDVAIEILDANFAIQDLINLLSKSHTTIDEKSNSGLIKLS